jgi:hypothetical protein
MTPQEQAFLEKEIRRSKLWGKLTFGELMDALERQYDALMAIGSDFTVAPHLRTIANEAIKPSKK